MATTLDMIFGTADGDGTPARLTQQTTRVVQPETPPMEPGPDEYVNTVAQAAKPPVTVAQAQQETQGAGTAGDGGADKRHLSCMEITQLLSPYTPPTEEELAKERKKQKRDRVLAAIGDGLRAMHEAYSYGRGVKPMTSGPSMSATVRTRYEQLKKERDAQKGAYLNAYMRALQMDDEAARDDRNWRHTLEREKLGDQYKEREFAIREAKADHDAAMNDLKIKLYMGKIDQQNYENEVARIKAQYQEKLSQSQINKNNAAARSSNASAGASNARARYYDRGGGTGRTDEKNKNKQEAYDYWMSLTPQQKKVYRKQNHRIKAKDRYGTTYMDDDDKFIQLVWKQRQGWLNGQKPAKGHSSKPNKYGNTSKIKW